MKLTKSKLQEIIKEELENFSEKFKASINKEVKNQPKVVTKATPEIDTDAE